MFSEPYVFNAISWNNVEDLKEFVYNGLHAAAMKDRKKWFRESGHAKYSLFWVEAGFDVSEKYAADKLNTYAKIGASPDAFDFKSIYHKKSFL